MARLGTTFNAQDHDTDQNDFELLPNGIYKLEVSASDIKVENGATTLALTYDVIEPADYAKRRIFAYIDLEHPETERTERGQRDFAKLCRAMELSTVEDSEELHFIAFTAKVKKGEAGVSKAGRPYKAKNSIQRFYFPDEGNVPEPAIDANQPAPAPVARAQAPANDNRPAAAAAPARAAGSRPWGSKA